MGEIGIDSKIKARSVVNVGKGWQHGLAHKQGGKCAEDALKMRCNHENLQNYIQPRGHNYNRI
jgi:hypothetical protein